MARDFWLKFGSGNPSDNSGLSPTFTTFITGAGQTLPPPGITEPFAGSGLYRFTYPPGSTFLNVAFVVDGATTGLADIDRYIVGVLDPQDILYQAVGKSDSSPGNDSTPPTDLFGYMLRVSELQEADETYTKASGILQQKFKGTETLIASKTITDSTTEIVKVDTP